MASESKSRKLPNAPLQEVIFELLWEIEFDPIGNPIDPEFEFAQGIFANKVMSEFPVRKRTIPERVPIKIYPKTIHQFWKEDSKWPVVQIGPGILAINDTEQNYDWQTDFYPLIMREVEILEESYNRELRYKSVSLRYIDAIEIGSEEKLDLLKCVNSKFNLQFSNKFQVPGTLSNLNLTQTFDVNSDTKVSLILNDGINKFNKPTLIWQTHVVSNTKKGKQEVIEWANSAHKITSELFVDILEKDFYDSFK